MELKLFSPEYDETYIEYEVETTDELVDISNKMRKERGYTDLVTVENDNDVYYTYFLMYEKDKKDITLHFQCNHGESDDWVWYDIDVDKNELYHVLIMQLEKEVNDAYSGNTRPWLK